MNVGDVVKRTGTGRYSNGLWKSALDRIDAQPKDVFIVAGIASFPPVGIRLKRLSDGAALCPAHCFNHLGDRFSWISKNFELVERQVEIIRFK